MSAQSVAIVGAGVGGLATAARLGKSGFQVEVFEKLSRCGGRNNMLEDKGFKFDLGPSFVLMPDFFKEVFDYCGVRLEDYLKLRVLDISYKIFYADGQTLTVHKDSQRTKQELEKIEPGAGAGFDGFIQEVSRFYQAARPLLYNCFSPRSALNLKYWPLLFQLRIGQDWWQLARRFFKSEKLAYAFTFEAMFMGVSPFQAPAFYSIISYADHVQKIFHPMGGMYEIPLALERLAGKFSVQFNYNTEITEIIQEKEQILLRAGEKNRRFDKVVVNADYAYAQTDLLNRPIPDYKYSCSVLLFYWGLSKKINGLAHHNLFFSAELRKNLAEIFELQAVPEDPAFYVHVPTVTDPTLAPQDKDLMYVLIPVPNLKGAPDSIQGHQQRLRDLVIAKVSRVLGINLEDLIELEHEFYPQEFISRYNIKHGATFGLAHNLMQSAFFRPANYDQRMKNLFFVGASTQPGGGLPVVIASSKITADLINHSLGR
ncbi:phytoene desaturase family protein [Candidatus Omnitrophota bacterium]